MQQKGSASAVHSDAPFRGLPRCSQSAHWKIRPPHPLAIQRSNLLALPALPQTAAALPARPTSHDREARQCSLLSHCAAEALPAPARQAPATAVPVALQPPACLDRAGLETGSAYSHPQPLLPDTRRGQSGQRLLRSLSSAQSGAEKALLHCLRRYGWQSVELAIDSETWTLGRPLATRRWCACEYYSLGGCVVHLRRTLCPVRIESLIAGAQHHRTRWKPPSMPRTSGCGGPASHDWYDNRVTLLYRSPCLPITMKHCAQYQKPAISTGASVLQTARCSLIGLSRVRLTQAKGPRSL
jgi:hypothetical protein